MAWIIADVDGQFELLWIGDADESDRKGAGFEHLPEGLDDNALIDPPANLALWLRQRQDARNLADQLAADEARQQADHEEQSLLSRTGSQKGTAALCAALLTPREQAAIAARVARRYHD